MRGPVRITHEFVEFIPSELSEDTLYISIPYATCSHLCFCGCGQRVVTPLSPTDWRLTFDGVAISLDPSVGNWSFDCQSHYWIQRNRVKWSTRWSREQIEANRARARQDKERFYRDQSGLEREPPAAASPSGHRRGKSWLRKLLARFRQGAGQ